MSPGFQPSDAVDRSGRRRSWRPSSRGAGRCWTCGARPGCARGSTRSSFDEKAAAYVAKDPAAYRAALEAVRPKHSPPCRTGRRPRSTPLLRGLAAAKGIKFGAVMQPVRIALTGTTVSEPVNELIAVVGKDLTLERVAEALRAA